MSEEYKDYSIIDYKIVCFLKAINCSCLICAWRFKYTGSHGYEREFYKFIYDNLKASSGIRLRKKESLSELLERVIEYLNLLNCQCLVCYVDLFFTAIHGLDIIVNWAEISDKTIIDFKERVLEMDNYRPHITSSLIC